MKQTRAIQRSGVQFWVHRIRQLRQPIWTFGWQLVSWLLY